MSRALQIGILAFLGAIVVGRDEPAIGQPSRGQEFPLVEVGSGPIGESAVRIVGRLLYAPERVLVFGYFTEVKGLAPGQIADGDGRPSAASATFTFASEIAVDDRAEVGRTVTVGGSGIARIYYNEAGGADWDDPATFGNGAAVAEWELGWRDILHLQTEGMGSVVGDERARQVEATPFEIAEERFRFGHVGLEQRVQLVGALGGEDAAIDGQAAAFVGVVTATTRVANPSGADGDGEAPPAATPAQADCADVETWADATLDRTVGARVYTDTVRKAAADVDFGAAYAAVTAAGGMLPDLVAGQRAEPVPAAADAAHRLAVTALSTLERGERLVAAATVASDEAALEEAQAVLSDGRALLSRAERALFNLQAACAG